MSFKFCKFIWAHLRTSNANLPPSMPTPLSLSWFWSGRGGDLHLNDLPDRCQGNGGEMVAAGWLQKQEKGMMVMVVVVVLMRMMVTLMKFLGTNLMMMISGGEADGALFEGHYWEGGTWPTSSTLSPFNRFLSSYSFRCVQEFYAGRKNFFIWESFWIWSDGWSPWRYPPTTPHRSASGFSTGLARLSFAAGGQCHLHRCHHRDRHHNCCHHRDRHRHH